MLIGPHIFNGSLILNTVNACFLRHYKTMGKITNIHVSFNHEVLAIY